MAKLPKRFEKFVKEYPAVAEAYEKLGKAVHESGPVAEKERALIKLALSIGAKSEGAVHSHTRRALECGAVKAEIRQVALLAIPTLGFPAAMAALSWIEDILSKKK